MPKLFISKKAVNEYGIYYFENCSDVEEVEVEEGHPHLYSVGNCVLKKGEMKLLRACKNSQIPAFVRRIARSAFARLRGLGDIELPYAVEIIDSYAFKECDIKSITLSENLIRIGSNAFEKCEELVSITFSPTLRRSESGRFPTVQA